MKASKGKEFSVSLVVTTYNWKDALEMVLRSIIQQKTLPNEVIIADDGSRNDTKLLIESYQKNFPVPLIHCWHEDKGFRAAAIRNKAIHTAKGEYIILTDGDIVLGKSFIQDHKRIAQTNYLIQGSRVLLSENTTKKYIADKNIRFSFFTKGIKNHLNTLSIPILSFLFSQNRGGHTNVRSCNMACWKKDIVKVNGFNEDFVGWGREDSEFVIRMYNAGLKRKNLKFGGVAFHLYHPENSRALLDKNNDLMNKSMEEKISYCPNGLNKYTEQP